MKPNSAGISTPLYKSILKDISLIDEKAQTEGDDSLAAGERPSDGGKSKVRKRILGS